LRPDVPLRGRPDVPLRGVPVSGDLPLPLRTEEGRLIFMEARALIENLGGERARFVRMARLRVANEADAEDIVHRAVLRAAERADQIADATHARAWFYRILRRAIVDHHRSQAAAVRREVTEHEPVAEAERPPQTTCRCAVRLIGEMRPAYAELVRRVDFEGEDPAALAAALRISPGNLYVRLHRARRALRERVQAHCGVTSIEPCLECMCNAHHRCG
jgi:RNA polymerase sigma-70 factor (ECF subfamily)